MTVFLLCLTLLSATQVHQQGNTHDSTQHRYPAPLTTAATVLQASAVTSEKEAERCYLSRISDPEILPVWLSFLAIAAGVIFAYRTLVAIETQVSEMRETGEQMERSIAQATRAAEAMEEVAEHIEASAETARESVDALRERTAQQMRAYLTVVIGGADYQERAKNGKFLGKARVVNAGHTPARKVKYKVMAAILPTPLPHGYMLPSLPPDYVGGAVIGPQQDAILSGVVDAFVPDQDVDDIRYIRSGKGLYLWGEIVYDDIFGDSHFTTFCQALYWTNNDTVWGTFVPDRNDSD